MDLNALGVRLALLAVLVLIAALDFRTRKVPPALSIPLLALGAGRCLAEGNVLAVAAMVLALWNVGAPWMHAAIGAGSLALGFVTGRSSFAVAPLLTLTVYRMWRAGWIGGGDGKLMMALGCLYPKPDMVLALAAGWLLWGMLWLAVRYRRAFLSAVALSAGGHLPPGGDLDRAGVPGTGGIALGFALFLLSAIWR